MKTIAEFVENEEIFNIVKEMGIDYSQGYFFSMPIETL
jgi:EAL domain-containing protein (putative c-di-GMP-specific phosphodiesterase class I)